MDHKRLTTQEQADANAVAERRATVAEWKEKGLVFEVPDMEAAVVEAHTHAAVTTGFEPLDPAKKVGGIERAA
jgi:hypothetical protein